MAKTIVITGAGGVLGSTIAVSLAKEGYQIALLDLKKDAVDQVAKTITDNGGKAISICANVLNKESLNKANDIIKEKIGSCDILINGAGGNHPLGTTSLSHFREEDLLQKNEDLRTFFNLDTEGIQFVFNLNFLGTLLPTQVFAKEMAGKKGCSILNISSMNAFTPLTKIPAYSAAKAAVSNFTQWLAVHFSKVGLRVNALAPGFFLTEQNRTLLTNKSGDLTDRGNTIIKQTPLGKFGSPEDLVGATSWLCSDNASFVTGIIIPIDGGFSAYSGV